MKFNVVKFCTNLTKFFYKLRTSAKGEGGGVCQMRTNADRGEGGPKNGHFVRTSFMDDPLWIWRKYLIGCLERWFGGSEISGYAWIMSVIRLCMRMLG